MEKHSKFYAMDEKIYESPNMDVIEIVSEGVLCHSGVGGGIDDIVEGNNGF